VSKAANPFAAVIPRWQADPGLFVREAFGAEPDPWQDAVLGQYGRVLRGEDERRGISIASCNGAGKTCLMAWLAWHNLLCFFPSRTAITAPSKQTAFDAFFAELSHWGDKLPKDVRELVEIKGDSVVLVARPRDAFLTVKTARKENPEAIQGVHADEGRVLILADESSGVDDEVFLAGRGSMSGKNAITLLISNPTRRSGYFYDTHHALKGLWYAMQVSWRDSSRTDQRFEEETRLTYGEDSNEYRVYVLGQFPTQDDDAIIPFDLIDAAARRDVKPSPNVPVVWGLDVARSLNHDASCLCKRRGNVVLEPVREWHLDDGMVLCGAVAEEYRNTPERDRPVEILVDAIGMGGPVVDRLREVGLPARGINVAETPSFDGKDRYTNLKSELWIGRARDWFVQRMGSIPAKDAKLIAGLQMPRREFDSSGGKMKVELKENTKKREKNKPGLDHADAFVLTFASDAASFVHGASGSVSWGAPLKRTVPGVL
jgi:hypothetical protein